MECMMIDTSEESRHFFGKPDEGGDGEMEKEGECIHKEVRCKSVMQL